ncbi:MAG: hypothetical protein PWQ54_2103 [Bacteroidales bacterium]|jgi:hypothetical protein|nr:hypothetical protein [Bacteroidales bacterium]
MITLININHAKISILLLLNFLNPKYAAHSLSKSAR